MKRIPLAAALTAALAVPAAAQTSISPATSCESLAKAALPDATITLAAAVGPGAFRPAVETDGRRAWAETTFGKLPPFCRVAATLRPSDDSDIKVEVWMPAAGWNGRFQGVGNGGFGGSIDYESLGDAVAHGYAAAASDTGHVSANITDASWALHHPEKIADFGYRAIHEMTVAGKAITAAFYGEAPRHAYFSSCSNGGRQALMEAQRFPEDYDGIIAGAPANNWTGLLALAGLGVKSLAGAYIPASKLPAIQAASLTACDLNDRVKDGVIENPAACRFDPGSLLCAGDETDACLTAPQIATLRTFYGGLHDESGRTLMPGYSPGAEAEDGGWAPWITGPAPETSLMYHFATNFYRFMVFSDPAWDYRTFDPARDRAASVDKVGGLLDATNADLTAFRERGGKLILHHGWNDAAIPAASTIDYYDRVVEHAGDRAARDFVRLYMVPGMQHCGGGPGPDTFGAWGVPRGQPSRDLAAALEAWVERGEAPGSVIASKVDEGEVVRTRPLCPYPQIAVYKGTGSTDDATSFTCAGPGAVAR